MSHMTPSSVTHQQNQKSWRARLGGGLRARERQLIFTVVLPAILLYLTFRYYPVLRTLFLSLTDAQLIKPGYSFVGFANFAELFGDELFLKTLRNTTIYSAATTLIGTALSLALAFILNPLRRGGSLFRFIYFLPSLTSVVAIAAVWKWLYQPRFGLFNQALDLLGLPAIGWLNSPQWALPSLIIMALWAGVGYSALIFIAGLQGIPVMYSEAAVIDGASPLQVALRIKLPLLSRVVSFVLVSGFVGSFQSFQNAFVMTNGGPLDATRFVALHIYDYAFQRLQIGQAAAMSFVLLVVVSVFTVLQLRLQRSDWEL